MIQGWSMAVGSSKCLPRVVRVLAGAIAVAYPMIAHAHGPVGPGAIEAQHPTGHVDDHGDLTWPPQPRGIANVVLFDNSWAQVRAAGAVAQLTEDREHIALARPDVRRALGTRFTRVAVAEDEDKSAARPISHLMYFSYSRNTNVEVTMDGDQVLAVTRTRPSAYQPEVTDAEAADAEALARAYFAKPGTERVSQLKGFSILAYKPRRAGFFNTRVLYVSFHLNDDAPPEYVAWVDLTRQRVLRAQEQPR